MSFSKRIGIKPSSKDIQVNSMDTDLKNGLSNVIYLNLFYGKNRFIRDYIHKNLLFKLWDELFKLRVNEINLNKYIDDFRYTDIDPLYDKMKWVEVYDLIEFVEQNLDDDNLKLKFKNDCNKVLEREFSGYRFVGDFITQITSDEEIKEIENAINYPLQSVKAHLTTAINLMSNREKPDYRNSIKESISAVESLCVKIAGNKMGSDTLGKDLDEIRKNNPKILPNLLYESFKKLYKYTNSEKEGIRHGLQDVPKISLAEARFMLIACSAFLNYLITKADDAGLSIS